MYSVRTQNRLVTLRANAPRILCGGILESTLGCFTKDEVSGSAAFALSTPGLVVAIIALVVMAVIKK